MSIATQLRASRTMSPTKPKARLAARRSVGGFGGSRRFFGPSRGQLSLEDVAFMCQSQRSCGQRGRWFWLGRERVIPPRKGPPILLGKQRAPLGGYPRGAPLDHFCILFLREKDGGQCPQPDGAVVPLATKTRVTRQCRKQNLRRVLLPARAASCSPLGARRPVLAGTGGR